MTRGCVRCLDALRALICRRDRAAGWARYVTLTGPGLPEPIVVCGAAAHPFSMTALMVMRSRSSTPPASVDFPSVVAGTHLVYVLTRDNWDLVRYYPHPRGRRGALYYAGLLTGTSAHDAHWFASTPAGERALRRLLARHGIHLR